jgi:hypothetical protein
VAKVQLALVEAALLSILIYSYTIAVQFLLQASCKLSESLANSWMCDVRNELIASMLREDA